jgi:iron complex outermembrane receptor protein
MPGLNSSVSGAALIACGLLSATQAIAQENKVETVVVTAERRAVDLQRAPIAASVLTGTDLQKKSVNVVDALMFATPNLTINNFGQGNDFNIRGIGKGESNVQTPSGVVTYRNGIPTPGGFVQEEPYYDIASIEVLRGPQGTFAGTNATGGAVFITEVNPDLNGAYDGYVQGTIGSYTEADVQGALNVPITDDLAARFAFDTERHDSFWTITKGAGFSGHPGRYQAVSARASFLWRPMQNLDVLFKTDVNYFDNGGYPADPSTATNDIFHIGNNTHNMAIDDGLRSVLDIKYTFEDGMLLRSISGYQTGRASEDIDLDGTNLAGLTFSDIGKSQFWTQELNLISPDTGPFTWILGGFFEHESISLPAKGGFDIGLPPGFIDVVLTYHTPKQHEAVFGQLTYAITDDLTIQAGARYNHSTFDLKDHQQTLLFGVIPLATFDVPCVGPTPACPVTRTGHQSDSKVTGKVSLNWKMDDRNFFYVFFATGHKDGGQNTTSNEPANFIPEEVRNVEVGWKWSFWQDHVRTQLAGYWNDYKNFQLSLFDPTTQTSPILNAPSAKSMGIELQAQGTWDRFSFDVNGSWAHSRFGSFFGLPVGSTPPGPPVFTCNTHTGGTDPACVNLTGETLVYAPAWTFNMGMQYAIPLRNGDTLTPRVDYGFVGQQWTSVFHSPAVRLGDRNIINTQLSYDWSDDWQLTAFATNLFDLHYVAAANVSLRYAGPPRQFGLRLTKGF